MRSSVKLAQEKGASNWPSCLPLKSHNFVLHKTAFRDAIALCYHWLPSACSTAFAEQNIAMNGSELSSVLGVMRYISNALRNIITFVVTK